MHLYALDVLQEDLEYTKSVLKSAGLEVSNINAFTEEGFWPRINVSPQNIPPNQEFGPYFASSEEDFREVGDCYTINPQKWRIAYTKRCIDIAKFLGAPGISINTGKLSRGMTKEKAWPDIVSSFKEIVAYGEEKNVAIFLEFEPGFECLWNSRDVVKLFDEIPSPYLKANYDIGHGYVALGSTEAVARDIRMLGDKIGHFHIEDIAKEEIEKPTHEHLMIGDGDIDFVPILRAIEDIGGGVVTCELYTYKDRWAWAAETAYQKLQTILSDL